MAKPTTQEQLNNPLHGLKLETLLNEIVSHYGFSILAEYTRIKCFKNNPSITSSLKFLRKTDWAKEKVERFYLYTFKGLPEPGEEQFEIPARQRIIPEHQKPKAPKVLKEGQAPAAFYQDQTNAKTKGFRGEGGKPASKRSTPNRAKQKPASAQSDDPWAAFNSQEDE